MDKLLAIGLQGSRSAKSFFQQYQHLKIFVAFDSNCEFFDPAYQDRFLFIRGDSLTTVPLFIQRVPQLKFDLIYIDGRRPFEWLVADITNARQLADENTVLWVDGSDGAVKFCEALQYIKMEGGSWKFIQGESSDLGDGVVVGGDLSQEWLLSCWEFIFQMEGLVVPEGSAWRSSGIEEGDGVVVGADLSQEWLLSWWWEHYRKHNAYPVIFVDFGMSLEGRDWCRQRGEVVPLGVLESQWRCHAWFKKPLACLQTRFRRSLWIDLDCEVRGSIAPLFPYADHSSGIAMAKDVGSGDRYPLYNSGVVAFRRDREVVVQWALNCIECNGDFHGDQEVFSHLVAEKGIAIAEIPPLYNWSRCHREHSDAILLHWHGLDGKLAIKNQIDAAGICGTVREIFR